MEYVLDVILQVTVNAIFYWDNVLVKQLPRVMIILQLVARQDNLGQLVVVESQLENTQQEVQYMQVEIFTLVSVQDITYMIVVVRL